MPSHARELTRLNALVRENAELRARIEQLETSAAGAGGPPRAEAPAASRGGGPASSVVRLRPVAEPSAAEPRSSGVRTAPALVLIVEDEPEMRCSLADALSHAYRVVTASDGDEGLSMARELGPDLVLTDVAMPRLSGDALVAALRATPELVRTPVLVVSARAEDALRARILQAGAIDYLQKPFSVGELEARVANLVAIKRGNDALHQQAVDLRGEVERARRHVEAIVASSGDAIYGRGLDGTILSWNAAAERLYGWSAAEVIGRPSSMLVPADVVDELEHPFERVLGGTVEQLDTHRVHKDGSLVEVAITLSPIRDDEGRVIGSSVIARDIGERKRADDERARLLLALERAVCVRDEFLSLASHELRTPLTPLRLTVQGMLRTLGRGARLSGDRLVARLELIDRQVQRVESLVEQLLDVSHISGGRVDMELDEVDLGALARDVAARLGPRLATARCELVLRAHEPVVGHWDRARLEQITLHLLENALKYGPGEPIELVVERVADRARLVVRDHGIGIPAEALGRVFDRFERLGSERHYGGFGLGLWLTREIVRAHGGVIDVASRPGEGATFRIDLPLAPPGFDAGGR
jgi:PAS domain S-box-containing protein